MLSRRNTYIYIYTYYRAPQDTSQFWNGILLTDKTKINFKLNYMEKVIGIMTESKPHHSYDIRRQCDGMAMFATWPPVVVDYSCLLLIWMSPWKSSTC